MFEKLPEFLEELEKVSLQKKNSSQNIMEKYSPNRDFVLAYSYLLALTGHWPIYETQQTRTLLDFLEPEANLEWDRILKQRRIFLSELARSQN